MSASRPVIVFIPGSFEPASLYTTVVADLESHGYEAHAIELETVGRRDTPPSMYDDAAKVASLIHKLADEGKDVVLVPHSYGGMVACEASKGLAKSVREREGKRGGVAKIVFVTAVAPLLGQSVKDLFPAGALDFTSQRMDICKPTQLQSQRSGDLPFDEAFAIASKLPDHVAASYTQPITYAPYKDIPSSYLFCENDKLIVPELQEKMIAGMESEMPMGTKVDRHSVKADHGIVLSQPKAVVEVVRRVVGGTAE
ncbi:AB hydrolase-1 domain-containing protein [Favolaschia claudopus]|uniref:AB hydrolase-1 domain-containing protein n=1 Tax=Favolaschia claudopus TaxID=2862362 RepID=A0AAW0D086_9AGAR